MARTSFQRGRVELRGRRAGAVWVLRYRARDGDRCKQKTEVLCAADARDIRRGKPSKAIMELADHRMAEVNAQNNGPETETVSFSDFVASGGLWAACMAGRLVKPSTIYSYRSMLDRFVIPALGAKRMDQIQPDDITRLLAGAHEKRLVDGQAKSLSSKYRLNLYALLKSIFEVAVEYDFTSRNPVRRKLHRPKWERRKKVALTPSQVARVVLSVPEERRVLVLCVALTALRIGEVLALRWQDIDFQTGKLAVAHNLWRGRLVTPKTDGSAATVPLASTLIEALQEHWRRSDWTEPGDFVFCKLDGSPCDPDQLRNEVLYPALEATGIERVAGMHGFHLFRHSAASIVEAQTGSLKLTQEFLRHSNISTTGDIYVHVDENNTRAAVEALASAIANCGLTVAEGVQ